MIQNFRQLQTFSEHQNPELSTLSFNLRTSYKIIIFFIINESHLYFRIKRMRHSKYAKSIYFVLQLFYDELIFHLGADFYISIDENGYSLQMISVLFVWNWFAIIELYLNIIK